MGVPSDNKAKLVAYQVNGVAKIWYKQRVDERDLKVGLIVWEEFKCALLDKLFFIQLREAKVQEFINLKQGFMSVRNYVFKFSKLSKHALFMVAD